MRMPDAQVSRLKEEALASIGRMLPKYADLQTLYMSMVHMPDYVAFAEEWDGSLYGPIRKEVDSILMGQPVSADDSLLYCAPGPHTPLLSKNGTDSLASRFHLVTLLDIDAASLRSAKQRLIHSNLATRIETAALDFSGPFGQRLCDSYVTALRSAKTPAEVAKFLASAHSLCSSIFHDAEEVLAELTKKLDHITGSQRYACSVSEMVASFTGTAVWLAFRSALYERFAGRCELEELTACLKAATVLWQGYNELFLAFHLDFLKNHTRKGGYAVLAFDTRKIYDHPELGTLAALGDTAQILDIMEKRGFSVSHKTLLSWRDHPSGFDVCLHGIPVSDFQAHTHDVELYFIRVEN